MITAELCNHIHHSTEVGIALVAFIFGVAMGMAVIVSVAYWKTYVK